VGEIEVRGAAEVDRQMNPGELGRFDENRHDWNTLGADSVGLGGADLLDKELIDYLVKVPHRIVEITFYQGTLIKNGHDGAFVSATAMIAPEDVLAKRFRGNEKATKWDDLPFMPEDIVVYNDGSTGMYRQVVKVLHENGYIGLPDPVIEGGGVGESTYDLHPSKWTGLDPKRARQLPNKEDGTFGGVAFYIRIDAPRGIRYSSYENENGEGRTRYIG